MIAEVVAALVLVLLMVCCYRRYCRRQHSRDQLYAAVSVAVTGTAPEAKWIRANTPEGKPYWVHKDTEAVRWSDPALQ